MARSFLAAAILLMSLHNSLAFLDNQCQTIYEISGAMFTNDVNGFKDTEFKVDLQTRVRFESDPANFVDEAPRRLFQYVDTHKLNTGTYALFRALLNNYDPVKGHTERSTQQETAEKNAFLKAVLETKVMDLLLEYSKCRGWVKDKAEFRAKLEKTWFQEFARSWGSGDTSGFEHVFVGEFKDGESVNGFHSWVAFYEMEKAGRLNYYGYVSSSYAKNVLVGARFEWDKHYKDIGSFFLRVSPELDLAVYTLCFWHSPGERCQIDPARGSAISIKTYDKDGHLGTAYPYV